MTEHRTESRIVAGCIILVSVGVGLYVAETTVGYYPPINHCPNAEIACPSGNIKNVIPSLVASAIAILILGGLTICYGYCRAFYEQRMPTKET